MSAVCFTAIDRQMSEAFLFHVEGFPLSENVSSPSKTLMANSADNNRSFGFQSRKEWSLFRAQQGRKWMVLGSRVNFRVVSTDYEISTGQRVGVTKNQ